VHNTVLIFRHELSVTVRRTGFLVMTLIVPVLALLAIGIAKLATSSGAQKAPAGERIGYVDDSGRYGQFTHQGSITLVRFGAPEEASRAMAAGEITEYFVIPPDYMTTMTIARYTMRKEMLAPPPSVAAVKSFITSNILSGNLPPAAITIVEAPLFMTTTRLGPSGAAAADQGGVSAALVPLGFCLLLVLSLIFSSSYLLQGLAEEKENRLMEILVSRVAPEELLVGKVLGLGAAGLVQVAVWLGTVPILLALASSTIGGFMTTLRVPGIFYVLAFLFFTLGYLLMAMLSASIGAITSSAKEAGQLSALFTLFPVVPLWFMSLFLAFPQHPVWVVLSLFPLTAPIMVLERIGISDVPVWQIIASLGVLLLSFVGGLFFCTRVFRTYLLMYGKRPGLGEIIRSLRGR
jgi:ABC-2 type transport system permease protein